MISSASDTPQRQQRVGALWRWRRVSGGGCSSDSSELSVSSRSRLLPPPSLPLFCFPFPFPLPSPSRRPDPEEAAAAAAAEFSVKVSGAAAGAAAAAAAEWSALKWPPSLAASSRVVQNGGRRRSRVGRPFFSVSSALRAPGTSSPLSSLPLVDGIEGAGGPRQSRWLSAAVPAGPGRAEARLCSARERAWQGRACCGEGRGPAGRARPLARDQPRRRRPGAQLPAGRCVGPRGRRGERPGCPWWGSEGPAPAASLVTGEEGKRGFLSFCRLGRRR